MNKKDTFKNMTLKTLDPAASSFISGSGPAEVKAPTPATAAPTEERKPDFDIDAYKEKLRAEITAEVKADLEIESKSVRMSFLLRPSIVKQLRDKAAAEGTSVNNMVNRLLYGALNTYREEVD